MTLPELLVIGAGLFFGFIIVWMFFEARQVKPQAKDSSDKKEAE